MGDSLSQSPLRLRTGFKFTQFDIRIGHTRELLDGWYWTF